MIGLSIAAALLALPVAQEHSGHGAAVPTEPTAEAAGCTPEHAAMGHCTMPEAATQAPQSDDADCPPEHAAMGHCTPESAQPKDGPAAAAPPPIGDAPAPAIAEADYADRIWGREAMAPVRAAIRSEHGGASFSQVMVDIAELQIREGHEGYRWEGEAWFGGDINRLLVKTEGEGVFGGGADHAEAQALYSRAIGPYFNLQGGIRQDFSPDARTYAAIGFEGLAPYWFEIETHAFVSTSGDLLARLAGSYDQRLTQRLILQPRAEVNLAAQDVPRTGLGAGLTDADFDLRLRYEIVREFAPYVGISHGVKFGRTAQYARSSEEDVASTMFVLGVRAWF